VPRELHKFQGLRYVPLFSDFDPYIMDLLCVVASNSHRLPINLLTPYRHRLTSKSMDVDDGPDAPDPPGGRYSAIREQRPFSGVFNRNPAELARALPRPHRPYPPVPTDWKPPTRAVPAVPERIVVCGVTEAAGVSHHLQRQSDASRLVPFC
jgi:hypothetical protein